MQFKMRPVLMLGAIALAASLGAAIVLAQSVALKRVMQQKLGHSQLILAAVVTSNWSEMERQSRSLLDLTNDPAWMVLKTPEYAKQSQAFVRAAEDLVDAARRKDGDAAPLAYVSMTLACVQCHRYVARSRVAGPDRQPSFGAR
jgi:hypothetical protein